MAEQKTGDVGHPNIYAALSAFQGELTPMPKNGEVKFQTRGGQEVMFKYTPLGDIMATIYPLLAKHGLSVRHEVSERGVEAILMHSTYKKTRGSLFEIAGGGGENNYTTSYIKKDGEDSTENELRSGIVKISQGGEMKDTGAAITYARRYTLTMVLGIASEEDKDAELLEQSAKNAIGYAFNRAKKGLDEAKTTKEIEKATNVLRKDLEALKGGKAGALGLSQEQYEELLKYADDRKSAIENTDETGKLID